MRRPSRAIADGPTLERAEEIAARTINKERLQRAVEDTPR